MKFIIDTYREAWEYFWQQRLIYIPEEYSFYMNSIVRKTDIELIINKISLSVSDNIVVNVNGFCGLDKSMSSDCQVPKYRKGILRVVHNLEYGFAYTVNDDSDYQYQVHVNFQTGWVCIGNSQKKGDAVEFINNCVAVIGENNEFLSLWLKPKALPNWATFQTC